MQGLNCAGRSGLYSPAPRIIVSTHNDLCCPMLTGSTLACLHACMVNHVTQAASAAKSSAAPSEGAKEPLQVRIPVAVKRRFKAHAAMRGLAPNKLFVEVWNHYERTLTAAALGGQAQ